MEVLNNNPIKPIVLKTMEGVAYFDYQEILMFRANGNNSLVYRIDNNNPVKILHNLSYIEKYYFNRVLFRCHRSFIINLNYIEKLNTKTRQITLRNNQVVPISHNNLGILRQITINPQDVDKSRLFSIFKLANLYRIWKLIFPRRKSSKRNRH